MALILAALSFLVAAVALVYAKRAAAAAHESVGLAREEARMPIPTRQPEPPPPFALRLLAALDEEQPSWLLELEHLDGAARPPRRGGPRRAR